jgi:uncharacterized protein
MTKPPKRHVEQIRVRHALEMTIEELKAKTSCTESKDISITFPSGQTRQFTGQSLLLGNMPNFFFQTTTAYNILRQCGVEIGKRDFMGTPPSS